MAMENIDSSRLFGGLYAGQILAIPSSRSSSIFLTPGGLLSRKPGIQAGGIGLGFGLALDLRCGRCRLMPMQSGFHYSCMYSTLI